jgi:hypothetical protein
MLQTLQGAHHPTGQVGSGRMARRLLRSGTCQDEKLKTAGSLYRFMISEFDPIPSGGDDGDHPGQRTHLSCSVENRGCTSGAPWLSTGLAGVLSTPTQRVLSCRRIRPIQNVRSCIPLGNLDGLRGGYLCRAGRRIYTHRHATLVEIVWTRHGGLRLADGETQANNQIASGFAAK